MAKGEASASVSKHGDLPMPLHIRNAPFKLMKSMDYGSDYRYAHSFEGNLVELEFLPPPLQTQNFMTPA